MIYKYCGVRYIYIRYVVMLIIVIKMVKFERNIRKSGDSYIIVIPPEIIRDYALEKGDVAVFDPFDSEQRIILTFKKKEEK